MTVYEVRNKLNELLNSGQITGNEVFGLWDIINTINVYHTKITNIFLIQQIVVMSFIKTGSKL